MNGSDMYSIQSSNVHLSMFWKSKSDSVANYNICGNNDNDTNIVIGVTQLRFTQFC